MHLVYAGLHEEPLKKVTCTCKYILIDEVMAEISDTMEINTTAE